MFCIPTEIIFLTGKAGTGKTTFLHQIKQLSAKRLAVVAPTGVAAINAGGVTIHSLFQLPFGPLVPGAVQREGRKFNRDKIRLLRSLDLLVIDEISMVRADVLDGIDEVLRQYRTNSKPFGGVQLLLIGDMQQLPPVIRDDDWTLLKPHYETGYFFGSKALRQTDYVSIELTHIYRQTDQRFIDLLNSIREKTVTREQLADLNQRYVPDFAPADSEGYITLSTHNTTAQQINSDKLRGLKTPLRTFEANIEGEFPANIYPTELNLDLKVGAQVMFIKNDISRDKLYYNGKIGQITAIDDDVIYVRSQSDGEEIDVYPADWTNIRYNLDAVTKEIKGESIGTFRQFPLKLAWAITIHKSQGLTFEKAIIDASAAFAHGQVYVALSRCKTLGGLVLRSPIPSHSIKTEQTLEDFHADVQQQTPTEQHLHDAKRTNQQTLLHDLFSFERANSLLYRCRRVINEHAGSLDPECTPIITQLTDLLRDKARDVTQAFSAAIARVLRQRWVARSQRRPYRNGFAKRLRISRLCSVMNCCRSCNAAPPTATISRCASYCSKPSMNSKRNCSASTKVSRVAGMGSRHSPICRPATMPNLTSSRNVKNSNVRLRMQLPALHAGVCMPF